VLYVLQQKVQLFPAKLHRFFGDDQAVETSGTT
jgi:hypothetical protein